MPLASLYLTAKAYISEFVLVAAAGLGKGDPTPPYNNLAAPDVFPVVGCPPVLAP
jgi:hypothetical protein